MIPIAYLNAVRGILDHLEKTQLDAVDRAAALVDHALRHEGAVFCADIGHDNQSDFINRAGGLAAVHPFKVQFAITDPVARCRWDRPRPQPVDRECETIRLAVRASQLRAGDVILIGSVSGSNIRPVELAMACRDHGVRVVALTAMDYTLKVASKHPSGNRLCEVADVVIDNGAPYGDAAVTVPGIDTAVLPVSGVVMTVCGWMIWGRVMERMAAAGDPPSVFMSVNRPEGPAYYERSRARYEERGY